jgi:addiction module HigA family antidote
MTSYNGPAMTSKRRRHPDLKPAHPGELLREIVIPGTGKTKVEIARLLGISRQSLYDILSEKQGVTPAIAMRLGKMFGDGPEVWLRMQNACDIWELDRDLKKDLAKIPRLTAA